MKLAYIHNRSFPGRAANTVQVVRMCAALAQAGHAVTLIARCAARPPGPDPAAELRAYYGIQHDLPLVVLPPPFELGGHALGRAVNSLRFARLAARRARQAGNRFVYARDPLVSIVAALSGLDVIHEDHAPPLGSLQRLLRRRLYQTRRLRRIVLISEALRGLLQAQGLLAADDPRLCVAPDAAALHQVLPRGAERPAAMRVGYVGGFLPGRGIELVLDIARALPAHDFLLVGGTRTDLPAQGAGLPDNVRCAGYLPPARLAEAYCQVDILLMPYQPDTATRGGVASAAWMSPLKLFEYLASGAAVLSSDLPVLREVLHDGENALLLPPVDRAAWISAIEDLAADPARRRALGCAGQASIRNRHNWPARAASILRGLPGAHA